MEVQDSMLGCGVQQLSDVGESPTIEDYRRAMTDAALNDCLGCFVVASVPWHWKDSVKFLKSVGFKSQGVRKNPNSGNKIVLLAKTLTTRERKAFSHVCDDCETPITGRKKYCDHCREDHKRWGY